jgi:hypothetical protein
VGPILAKRKISAPDKNKTPVVQLVAIHYMTELSQLTNYRQLSLLNILLDRMLKLNYVTSKLTLREFKVACVKSSAVSRVT